MEKTTEKALETILTKIKENDVRVAAVKANIEAIDAAIVKKEAEIVKALDDPNAYAELYAELEAEKGRRTALDKWLKMTRAAYTPQDVKNTWEAYEHERAGEYAKAIDKIERLKNDYLKQYAIIKSMMIAEDDMRDECGNLICAVDNNAINAMVAANSYGLNRLPGMSARDIEYCENRK